MYWMSAVRHVTVWCSSCTCNYSGCLLTGSYVISYVVVVLFLLFVSLQPYLLGICREWSIWMQNDVHWIVDWKFLYKFMRNFMYTYTVYNRCPRPYIDYAGCLNVWNGCTHGRSSRVKTSMTVATGLIACAAVARVNKHGIPPEIRGWSLRGYRPTILREPDAQGVYPVIPYNANHSWWKTFAVFAN